jgi:hypothetical protein
MLHGESNAARTMGDFLRDFTPENNEDLRKFLVQQSLFIRRQINNTKPVHYNVDTTFHVQCGKKLEGLAYNYKGQWGLDSQSVFDELGLCYGAELRAGNTKSGSDAIGIMTTALSDFSFQDEKYSHADSAYCHQEYIELQIRKGVKFTITAHEATTGWSKHLSEITDWAPWRFDLEYKKEALKRNQTLPKIEVGFFNWKPSWSDCLRLPIVVKRTWNNEENAWDYYAVVTNYSLYKNSGQTVIESHNTRGNCENFIREEKYGFDLKHFPTKRLAANEAYLLLGMVAHNLLRWMALVLNPKKPAFSKKLRHQFIFRPGKIANHAGKIVLSVSKNFYQEVQQLHVAWQSSLSPAQVGGTS